MVAEVRDRFINKSKWKIVDTKTYQLVNIKIFGVTD